MPKVSIVIPVYNVEKYLRECLDSLISQTLRDIEIICVNDGSTDSCPFILEEYLSNDERVKVISKANSGYGNTVNIGIDAAEGEYIAIVESDDYVIPDMYERLYALCKKYDLEMIKGDFCRFYGEGDLRETVKDSITNNQPLYNIVLNPSVDPELLNCNLYIWAGIYKKDFLHKHNIRLNETPGASYQDNGFWFQTFCLAERLMFVDEVFYHLRRDNPESSFHSKEKVFCMCDEFDFIMSFFDKNPEIKKRFIYKYHNIKYRNYMFTYERIADEHKPLFLKRMTDEFTQAMLAGELKRECFTESLWISLNTLLCFADSDTAQSLSMGDKIILYGAGNYGLYILDLIIVNNLPKPAEIWDINAKDKKERRGIPVIYPPFERIDRDYADAVIIIAIMDRDVAGSVEKRIKEASSHIRVLNRREVIYGKK